MVDKPSGKFGIFRKKRTWAFLGLFSLFLLFYLSDKFGQPHGLIHNAPAFKNKTTKVFNPDNPNEPNSNIEFGSITFKIPSNGRALLKNKCQKSRGLKSFSRHTLTTKDYTLNLNIKTTHGQFTNLLNATSCFNDEQELSFGGDRILEFEKNHSITDAANKAYAYIEETPKLKSHRPILEILKNTIGAMGLGDALKTEWATKEKLYPVEKHPIILVEKKADGFHYVQSETLILKFGNNLSVPVPYTVTWNEIKKPVVLPPDPKNKDSENDDVGNDIVINQPPNTQDWARLCKRDRFDAVCSITLLVRHWREEEPGFITGPYNDNVKLEIHNSDESEGRFLVNFAYDSSKDFWFGSGATIEGQKERKNIRRIVTPIPHHLGSIHSPSPFFKVKGYSKDNNTPDYTFHAKLRYEHELSEAAHPEKLNSYCMSEVAGSNCEPYYKVGIYVADKATCSRIGGDACIISGLQFTNISCSEAKEIYNQDRLSKSTVKCSIPITQ